VGGSIPRTPWTSAADTPITQTAVTPIVVGIRHTIVSLRSRSLGFHGGIVLGRDMAQGTGETPTEVQNDLTKGAHHGNPDTTDHPTLGTILQRDWHRCSGDGLVWPPPGECGSRACRARREWSEYARVSSEWDALQWD